MAPRLTRDRLRRLGRWLAVLLLVAQFGAEMHVSWHALADPVDRMGQAKTCGSCLASSQLQNAAAPPAPILPAYSAGWSTVVLESVAAADVPSPCRAYCSRAPPVLA